MTSRGPILHQENDSNGLRVLDSQWEGWFEKECAYMAKQGITLNRGDVEIFLPTFIAHKSLIYMVDLFHSLHSKAIAGQLLLFQETNSMKSGGDLITK